MAQTWFRFRIYVHFLLITFIGIFWFGTTELESKAASFAGQEIYVDSSLQQSCTGSQYSISNRDCSGSDGLGVKTFVEAFQYNSSDIHIFIREGTYNESIIVDFPGTPAQGNQTSLLIRGYQNENAVIDGVNIGSIGILVLRVKRLMFKI